MPNLPPLPAGCGFFRRLCLSRRLSDSLDRPSWRYPNLNRRCPALAVLQQTPRNVATIVQQASHRSRHYGRRSSAWLMRS